MKWLATFVGGQRWSVYLVSPNSKHLLVDGEYKAGTCDYVRCRINIANDLDEQAREDTLLHEFIHALLYVTGAQKAYGNSYEAEELLVSAITPSMHRLLKDLGFRFPRGPYL